MRKMFAQTVSSLIEYDHRVVTLLGDIGVYSFHKIMEKYPNRVMNIGILEQSMIGVAAGLSKKGLIPFVHTIAPFLVERAYEQLKVDFGYQELSANFVSVGGSSDYSKLGSTHHCPGDISLLLNIPGFQIFTPGTEKELEYAIKHNYNNDKPTYYRLSERSNKIDFDGGGLGGTLVKHGSKCTVVAFGPVLDMVLESCSDLDVEILYFYQLEPIDEKLIRERCGSHKILLVEPFYKHTMSWKFLEILRSPVVIRSIGYPREFIRNYGELDEHFELIGLTASNIRKQVMELIG